MAMAILACAGIVVLTTLLAPTDPEFWNREFVRPDPLLPPVAGALLEILRLVGLVAFGVVLYRAQVHLVDPTRRVVLGLALGTMILQATWNPLLYHLDSLLAGMVATGILAGALVTLVVILLPRERLSGWLLAPYALLAAHDFWWATALVRLNPGA